MTFDWGYAFSQVPKLLEGLRITVEATLLGSVLAMALGLVFALLRRSRFRVVSRGTKAFVEFVRSTPLLVQLFFLYYTLPNYGFKTSAFITGVIGLGVHFATYTSEVYRAGIEGVPTGQWEAATALSLPYHRVWTSVILPQAIPRVLPALGNYVISMFKEVPLLSAITVVGLLGEAKELGSHSFKYLELYTFVGILFLVVSLPASFLVRRLERRFGQ